MRRAERGGWGKADGRQEHLCPGNGASLAAGVSWAGLSPGAPRELPSQGDVLGGAQPVVEMWWQETGQTGRRGAAVTSTC